MGRPAHCSAAFGFDAATSTPEAFGRYIEAEIVKWRRVTNEMRLKPE